jgi:hypothetical protein
MSPQARRSVKLDAAAHEQLDKLQYAFRSRGLPRKVDKADIASALALYITEPQIAGILAEYYRDTEAQDQGQTE